MLIGCITGPDFETAKTQLALAQKLCDGIELRLDLLDCSLDLPQMDLIITTDEKGSTLSNGKTISIYHNFEETPQNLEAILESMPTADIYKIATMANSTTDALRMLIFCKNKPHVAGMCMGPFGQITRILGPIIQNPLTFAALGKEAAPGQLQAEELIYTYNYRSLTRQTRIYGLIGNPIEQSPSHKTHNAYFKENGLDAIYIKMLLQEEELPVFFQLIKKFPIDGLSVTIPFKEKLFDFIDVMDETAGEVGAVNTLTIDNLIYGANTDCTGALDAIEEKEMVKGKHCVILGAGGAAKAIGYEAQKRGALVTILSRRYGNLDQIPVYDILVNTTPVPCPIDIEELQPRKVVMDINFNRSESPFMLRAKALGCKLIFGESMFEKQAKGQFLRWQVEGENN